MSYLGFRYALEELAAARKHALALVETKVLQVRKAIARSDNANEFFDEKASTLLVELHSIADAYLAIGMIEPWQLMSWYNELHYLYGRHAFRWLEAMQQEAKA